MDDTMTERMAAIRARIEDFPPIAIRQEPGDPNDPHNRSLVIRLPLWTADDGSDTPEVVALYGSARRMRHFDALLLARADLAYLLDGLQALTAKYTAAQGREAPLRETLALVASCEAACIACAEEAQYALEVMSEAPFKAGPHARLLALGRASLALERAERAWGAALDDAGLSLAEGTARRAARERASQEYAAALKAAMEGEK
jgi:hypothetical protein